MKTWRFSALDSLFFRESRPFDVIGGSELSSVFPPSPATIAGAIRSAIGDHKGVDWQKYHQDTYHNIKTIIGDSSSLGKMRLKGVFLSRKISEQVWERFYPVPAHLVATHEKDKIKNLHFLTMGKPMHCDLGANVCLAVAESKGIKSLEDYWITQAGLNMVLAGELPDKKELIASSELFKNEARLGIARSNQSRTVIKSMLYQTQHIRPKNCIYLEVDVEGLDAIDDLQSGLVRLGGEGRGAHFEVLDSNQSLTSPGYSEALGIQLMLLSSAFVPQLENYTPLPGFKIQEHENETVWIGQINGIDLELHCAMTYKALREGGWDLQKKCAKPTRSLIPAGSVFLCKVQDIENALKALQNSQLESEPLDLALGRGLLTASLWFKH